MKKEPELLRYIPGLGCWRGLLGLHALPHRKGAPRILGFDRLRVVPPMRYFG